MAQLMHGVDLRFSTIGPRTVAQIPSNIIALVGTAPMGDINKLTYVKSAKDAAAFGAQVPGFTIAQALDAIFKEAGGTPVIVINVFDPALATTAVAAEALTLVAGKGKLAFPYVGAVLVKNQGGTITHVKDVDYSIDAYGTIRSLNYTTIAATAQLQITYNKPNFAAVTSAEIIGTVNGTSGARTGLKLLENAYNTLGIEPKIIIAPGFATSTAVVAEMLVWNKRLGAVSYIDAPSGTSVPAAIAGRGPAGNINFNVSDPSLYLLYPEVRAYDPATDSIVNRPLSPVAAGVTARVDREQSYSKSPSNEPIRGIVGLANQLSGSAFNADTDANALNLAGITTVINEGSGGFKLWGNRNAAYPSTTTPDNFLAVYRTLWIIGRSLQLTALQYVDKRITLVLVDGIRQTGNNFVNQLIGRGDLLDGSEVLYDPDNSDWAAGRLSYLVRVAPPTPGELITFNIGLDLNLYNNLTAA